MANLKRCFVVATMGVMLLVGLANCVVTPAPPCPPGYVISPPVVVIRPYRAYRPYRWYRPYRGWYAYPYRW
jgi:hypothetical protein